MLFNLPILKTEELIQLFVQESRQLLEAVDPLLKKSPYRETRVRLAEILFELEKRR